MDVASKCQQLWSAGDAEPTASPEDVLTHTQFQIALSFILRNSISSTGEMHFASGTDRTQKQTTVLHLQYLSATSPYVQKQLKSSKNS